MPDGESRVYAIDDGRLMGTTPDPEAVFLAALETALSRGGCYVVAGTAGHPDGFLDRLRERCTVVVDDATCGDGGVALIVAGDASEWDDPARP